jgi:hypothetical protein
VADFEADFVSDLNSGTADFDSSPTTPAPSSGGNLGTTILEDAQERKPAEPSLRDQLSSALKGEATDATPPAASQDGRARNPDGTFAPAPAVVDPNNPAPAAVAPVTVPQGLSAEDAALFVQLPAEMQASLARTMETVHERSTRLAGLESMEQLIAPRREAWALNGMTENQAVSQLLALSDYAGRDPAGFITYFAQNNGVDLEDVLYGAEPVDPQYAELQNKINNLEQQLGGFTTQQQQAAHNNVVNEVVAFQTEKDGNGQVIRPYFAELGADIYPFIQAVKSQNPNWNSNQVLQEAYDRACWGSPTVRTKLQAANEAARMRTQQDNVARARQAGSSIRLAHLSKPPKQTMVPRTCVPQYARLWQRSHSKDTLNARSQPVGNRHYDD